MREYEVNENADAYFLSGFNAYVADYYGEISSYSWNRIIDEHCSTVDLSFGMFATLFEKYVEETLNCKDKNKDSDTQ